jgi:hypothetical protein
MKGTLHLGLAAAVALMAAPIQEIRGGSFAFEIIAVSADGSALNRLGAVALSSLDGWRAGHLASTFIKFKNPNLTGKATLPFSRTPMAKKLPHFVFGVRTRRSSDALRSSRGGDVARFALPLPPWRSRTRVAGALNGS